MGWIVARKMMVSSDKRRTKGLLAIHQTICNCTYDIEVKELLSALDNFRDILTLKGLCHINAPRPLSSSSQYTSLHSSSSAP